MTNTVRQFISTISDVAKSSEWYYEEKVYEIVSNFPWTKPYSTWNRWAWKRPDVKILDG